MSPRHQSSSQSLRSIESRTASKACLFPWISETTAIFTSTVSPVRQTPAISSFALTAIAAELGVRLLRPDASAAPPDAPAPERYFTSDEIRRGRRYARPQLALGLAGSAAELAALGSLARRANPP